MQNKLHNRTIFVAALSVYLGLLAVGAPPQVLAQSSVGKLKQINFAENNSGRRNKTQEVDCSDVTVAEIIKVLASHADNLNTLTATNISYKVEFLKNRVVNSQILAAEGDSFLTEFFRRRTACGLNQKQKLSDKKQSQNNFSKELEEAATEVFPFVHSLFNFRANQNEIVFEMTHTFANAEAAKSFASFNKSLVEDFHKISADNPDLAAKDQLNSAIINSTIIRYENDQVFIVTRLPRGSLDSLLKANEKAN